ncbi:Trm112 family protein [Luteimonas salinilitoris]|uniref:Trm112 family protein n=1 Tax=Luteimonas salinilitoris TaxID=3237697 RepID=A0ABV4HQE0_9GAMM
MDHKLLDILVCPASRQPLALLSKAGLEALNRAVAGGGVTRVDDSVQTEPLQAALVTRDRKRVYRIDDGIPVLLVEEAIPTGQIDGFPAG